MRISTGVLAFAALSLLGACALPPKKLQGTYAEINPHQASTDQFIGSFVRWGGIVTGERLTDNGRCLEVAWYPLDRVSFHPVSQQLRSVIATRPRFLACGGVPDKKDIDRSNGTVTAVGGIDASKVYEVDRTFCVADRKNRYPVYINTIHTSNDDTCVISLPVLNVSAIQAWPDPPSHTRPFNGGCSFCGG